MKITRKICGLLALLAVTACSNDSEETADNRQVWHVTLTASMDDEQMRALNEETGNTISATFELGDEVIVMDADSTTKVGTLKPQSAGTTTTLSGYLDASSLAVGETVTLYYRSATADYDGQDGTLAGIADHQHYATGTLTVSSTSPLAFTTSSVTLQAQQSITKFSFHDDSNNSVKVKTFGIAATGLVQRIDGTGTVGAVTGTLTTPASDVYVALRNNSGAKQTYFFYVKDESGNWYTGTKKASLENAKYYTASVKLTKLPELTSSSDKGSIGVIDGLPAIVVNISGTNKAVALLNVGALCPEHYGAYYTYAQQATALTETGLSGWYVPTRDELEALAGISSSWVPQNGVNGRSFTIGGNTLFLPAAGLNDYDSNTSSYGMIYVSEWGYYASQTLASSSIFSLQFNDNVHSIKTYSNQKEDALTIRPFHTL